MHFGLLQPSKTHLPVPPRQATRTHSDRGPTPIATAMPVRS